MTLITGPIKVALVDDHHIVREGVKALLAAKADIQVVGEASDLAGAFALLDQVQPHVMVLDVAVGKEDSLSALPALKARRPDLKVLILTMHSDAETVRQALANGASGYLVKGAYSSELDIAIRATASGDRYLHSSITMQVVDDYLRGNADVVTAREREVLVLIANGRSASDVSDTLGISAHTVRRHLANLRTKLGLRGRGALLRYALGHDLMRSSN
jgi:DNA-binding NarL/FixJ family response regulator